MYVFVRVLGVVAYCHLESRVQSFCKYFYNVRAQSWLADNYRSQKVNNVGLSVVLS